MEQGACLNTYIVFKSADGSLDYLGDDIFLKQLVDANGCSRRGHVVGGLFGLHDY